MDARERKQAYDREHYLRNKKRKAVYQKARLTEHRAINRASYLRHREERVAARRLYEARTHNQRLAYHRARGKALKHEALAAYGGSQCVLCGATDFGDLTLDHVNGDGQEHRSLLTDGRTGGQPFYRKLKLLGWPDDPPLQVLCRVCNMAKSVREGTRHHGI